MTESRPAERPLLRPLERSDVPALTRLTRSNRAFLAASNPLRSEEHYTDAGQERAALASLEAAGNGTMLPMVIVDASGAVRLAAAHRDGVLDAARAYAATEEKVMAALAAGEPLVEAYRFKKLVVGELAATVAEWGR